MGFKQATLHAMTAAAAADAQKYARRARETYVPSRLRRLMKEEKQLMEDFDAAETPKERLEVLGGLVKARLFILRCIGWPREGALKSPKLPRSLETVRAGHPFGADAEVQAITADVIEPQASAEPARPAAGDGW